MRLFVQRDAELFEEPHGLVNRQRSQHPRDDARRPTVEVPRGHDAIRDIAASAAADENLGAKPPRAVEDDDRGAGAQRAAVMAVIKPAAPAADHQDGSEPSVISTDRCRRP